MTERKTNKHKYLEIITTKPVILIVKNKKKTNKNSNENLE